MSGGATPLRPETDNEPLYGVVIRPPNYGLADGRFHADILSAVTREPTTAGVRLITRGAFVGLVADRPERARQAAREIRLQWRSTAKTSLDTASTALEQQTELARNTGGEVVRGRYAWPNRMRWGLHPGWITAQYGPGGLTVWADSQAPELLRAELAMLCELDRERITLIGKTSNGLIRDCVDDAAADAALMARAVNGTVRVRLSADYARDVAALGGGQCLDFSATTSSDGDIITYQCKQQQPGNYAPVLALLLAGDTGKHPHSANHENRASTPPYHFRQSRIALRDGDEAWYLPELDGVQQTFARESFIDEVAEAMNTDPVALRRRHLRDERGLALIESVSRRAAWQWPPDRDRRNTKQAKVRGSGFAYGHTPDRAGELEHGTRSAWIVDLEVDTITGDVKLTRLVVGQDDGREADQEALKQQLQEQLLGQRRQLLASHDAVDAWPLHTKPHETEPQTTLPARPAQLPEIIALTPEASPASPPARIATTTLEPGVAAIANALHDATGERFRQPPFTPERIRAALQGSRKERSRHRRWPYLLGAATAAAVVTTAFPWKPAMDPISRPPANLYSEETIERGRLVASASFCMECHTAPGGRTNAGGREFDTPYGKLYSTNITPDEDTGIGRWSYSAFERAMRQGVSRDGRHLYPVFPYTAFAGMSDTDMQALYAYLMAQPAEPNETPTAEMAFPFGFRSLMAGWNAVFHDDSRFVPAPDKSPVWNRGAYLAESMAHCSACHTPRNAVGAEKGGFARLGGGLVDGWEAPPLNTLSHAPVPWTEESLYQYLREGYADHHGVAAGPMAPVVEGLRELPDEDVRAIAVYTASLMEPATPETPTVQARPSVEDSPLKIAAGERVFQGSCAACHDSGGAPSITAAHTSLALNSNLHSPLPNNTIQVILHGANVPGSTLADMPGFADSLNDDQVASLLAYLRHRFAPDKPAWTDTTSTIRELRTKGTH